jgi:arginyl-tRNA synthetase
MVDATIQIQQAAAAAIKDHFEVEIDPQILPVQETRKDFEGDFTLVVFPLSRYRLGAPHQVGETLGKLLVERLDIVSSYNVIKGFLNLSLTDEYWIQFLSDVHQNPDFLKTHQGKGQSIVVEYCSPNTNKPLHLGHLRNIVLGYSLTEILKANGYEAHPVCLYNDRGTAICKSMYAWQAAGKNDSPASTNKKGDVFVGDYYVAFSQMLKEQTAALVAQGMDEKEAEKAAEANQAINEMLIKWEAGDQEVRDLWKQMNGYVYEAHANTFKRLGVAYEKFYYESELYEEGKDAVLKGVDEGMFYKKEDGSVWIDLEDVKLDQKLLLRSNGTSIYITQDLGVADHKHADFNMQKSVYVVGNEQDYHFKVLFEILKKMDKPYADGLFHLSYGIVELPHGRMKSREGTIVEIDDLVDEVRVTTAKATEESEKIGGLDQTELSALYDQLALGAIKFFLIKVDPKKGMIFNPEESVQLQGHTGPYIQYAHARTRSILAKAASHELPTFQAGTSLEGALHHSEKELLMKLFQYKRALTEAAKNYNPAEIANYVYELAQSYSSFFANCRVIQSDHPNTSSFRLALSTFTGVVMKAALKLLGIEAPQKM